MPHEPAIDQECLETLRRGDAGALNRLIARWQRPLHSFAFRYCQNQADAEDLVAQVFVRLYQQRKRLRPDTRLSAWLFTTLANLCHNHHRWRRRHPAMPLDSEKAFSDGDGNPSPSPAQELASDQPTPAKALEHEEALVTLRGAIARLPHELKAALLLHHYDRLSYREIAEIVGCSERGVETRLYRARQQLRTLLAAEERKSVT